VIGFGKRLRDDLFCVEWDVKPQLSQFVVWKFEAELNYPVVCSYYKDVLVVIFVELAHSVAHMEAESILINVAGRLLLFQRDRSSTSGKASDTKEKRVRIYACLADFCTIL